MTPLRPLRASFLALIPCLFLGCGIDSFVYLYPVTQIINYPNTSDPTYNFFEFTTSDEKNYDAYGSNGYFRGFEIYYRIYNSDSSRNADVSDISTYNTNNPTTAFSYLANTKRYTRMVHSGKTTGLPLVQGGDKNKNVMIRLTNSGVYPAVFKIGGSAQGVPLRSLNEGTSFVAFDFDEIHSSDRDVSYTASGLSDRWFVQAYVVAYGYDEAYKTYYSEVFSLYYATVSK